MVIRSGVHYYLKVKRMTKILRLEIEGCWDCSYLDVDWCNNPKVDGYINTIEDHEAIPDWCPLEEVKSE